MKTLFTIGQEKEISSDHTLLIEIGKDHCCTAFFHRPTVTIEHLELRNFDETAINEALPEIIRSVVKKKLDSVVVSSAFPEALLFPAKFFNSDYSALDLVYDQPAQVYFNDPIPEWQVVTVYSMPQAVFNAVEEAFAKVRYLHTFSPSIKIYNGYAADNQLTVHFSNQYFSVLVKRDNAIHLAQTYFYKTPLDVIYYLLKICQEFHLSPQELHLVLSGLVEKDSHLFTDLHQYFAHVHFAQQPEIVLPESSHPHYFFTSMYNLAACVL